MPKSFGRVACAQFGWFRVPIIYTVNLVYSGINETTLIEKPVAEKDAEHDATFRAAELTTQSSYGDAEPKFGNSSIPDLVGKDIYIYDPAGMLYEGVNE